VADAYLTVGTTPHAPSSVLPHLTLQKSASVIHPSQGQDHVAPPEPKQKRVTKKGIQLTMYDALELPSPEAITDYDEVWGHFPEVIDDRATLHLLFANPKGLKLTNDIMETEYSMGRCRSLGVGVLCLAESNLNWDHPLATGKFHGLLRKIWKHSKVSKSFTKDHFQSPNQPGGTAYEEREERKYS